MENNILIAGVGGQGTILAGKIISSVALMAGYEIKVSEIHGMSQRGGSVVTQVRFGEQIASPIITEGSADTIIAFELLEALRILPELKKGGQMIVNEQIIPPMPVLTGTAVYPEPEEIKKRISAHAAKAILFDALALALTAGAAQAVNLVLLGCFSRLLPMKENLWHEAIKSLVKPQFVEMNLRAFNLGQKVNS